MTPTSRAPKGENGASTGAPLLGFPLAREENGLYRRKTGFCLDDRYDTSRSLPRNPSRAVLTVNCRLYEADARSVTMGISVVYGDDYRAYLE